MEGTFSYYVRPAGTEHRHPFLVFDTQGTLHLPLCGAAKAIAETTSAATMQAYLGALLPFFTFLARDPWQVRGGRRWDGPPELVRLSVDDYLVNRLHCTVRRHRDGFALVVPTAQTTGSTRQFLAALHAFYREAERLGFYPHGAPLTDRHRLARQAAEHGAAESTAPPRLPALSGVEAPRPRHRLTARYFVQVADTWIPQTINDPRFPSRVLIGGRSLGRWGLREECVTRLLFETGARLSEVVGLTLGGWQRKGLQQDAWTFNKGSHGRWTKVLHFRQDTAKLLRRYWDGERARADPAHRTLDQYLRLADHLPEALRTVPLFLSRRGTPYSGTLYREHYWQPACRAAGIQARPHQTRHWYVTRFIEHVHATATGEGELARGKRDLIAYMHWAAGEETMAAYDHVFDEARHAVLADQLHAALYADLNRAAARPPRPPSTPPASPGGSVPNEDAEYQFLLSLGGMRDG